MQTIRIRRQFFEADWRQTALATIIIALALTAVIRNDILLFEDGWTRRVLLASRLVCLGTSLLLLRRPRSLRQHDRAVGLALLTITIADVMTNITRMTVHEVQGPAFGVAGILNVLYFAHRGVRWQRVLTNIVVSISVLPLLWSAAGNSTSVSRFTGTIALVATNILGVYAVRAFDEQRRKRFEAERDERRARRELAEKLRELAAEKEHAEAMSRARSVFLATMSHEFRTPMNAVLGFSEVLLSRPLDAQDRDHVRVIHDSARGLLALLNNILDFAKSDAQKVTLSPAPFDLHALATAVTGMLSPSASARGLTLTLDVAPGAPAWLHGDEARLRQVLSNLLSNAIKFTERGSVTLRISSRAGEDGGDPEIAFRVEDTGVGMDPDVLSRLFQPFEQGDSGVARRYGGTGLGLAICKQIVTAMGGDLRVESEVGRGSVFSFALRLPRAEAPAQVSASAPERAAERSRLAILVVDDQPINHQVARGRFGQLGVTIDSANSGAEAIDAARAKDYDAIFLDVHMPGMSGIEAARRILEITAGRPTPYLVALTASVFEEDREACRRAGMHAFLGKPIDLAEVDAVLRRVSGERPVAGARSVAETPPKTDAMRLDALDQIESWAEPGFAQKLVALYLEDAPARVQRMKGALEKKDAEELAREAHALKSASATLGIQNVSEACGRVEQAARQTPTDLASLTAHVAKIAREVTEAERALTQRFGEEVLRAAKLSD